jgi:RNA polymerase sigma factor (sigma-70 family)
VIAESNLKRALDTGDQEIIKKEFEKIFNQYSRLVFSVAYLILNNRQDSEDCQMECFSSFFNQGAALYKVTNIKSYLASSAKYIAYHIAKKRDNVEYVEDLSQEAFEEEDVYSISDNSIIEELKGHLSSEELVILLDCAVLEKTFKEEAKDRHSTPNAIAGKYFRAKQKARKALEKIEYEIKKEN